MPPDADGLRGLARLVDVFDEPVCAAIESMNGTRFVHDRLEELGSLSGTQLRTRYGLPGVRFGRFEGLAAIRAFVNEYWATWDDHHHYAEEIVDLGQGVLYSVVLEEGRIKDSHAYIETRNAWVLLLVDGRVVRFTTYKDIDEARAAERLAESRG